MKSPLAVLLMLVFAISAASDDVRELYDKAVSAYDQGDYLQAISLIDRVLKLAPDDQQAAKMKLVIQAALHPADTTEGGSNGWSYSYGEGGIEVDPDYVRVYSLSAQPTAQPSYATYALPLPKNSVEWEADFKLRFGKQGDLETGVTLRQGDKVLVAIKGEDGKSLRMLAGSASSTCGFAGGWHECRVWWRAGSIEIDVDDTKQWSAPGTGVPDLMVFGAEPGKPGKESEAFLKWEGFSYNLPGQ